MNLLSNPLLTSELRRRIRGSRAMIILTVYLALTGIVTLLIYLAVVSSMSSFGQADFEAGRSIGKAIFLTVITAALVQVSIITPALTAGGIAGEKERQTYDLLIATLLSPWQIALGKLAAALAFALLLIVAVLPLAGLSFLFGGVSGVELVLAVIGLTVTAVLYATVGLFWSTVMRNTLAATVMAQGTIILSLLGIPFLFIVSLAIIESTSGLRDLTSSPLFIYIIGVLLYAHPFIALGHTEFLLSSGENPFFFTFESRQTQILAPSPWLAFTIIGSLLTLLFIVLSVRMIRPVQYDQSGRGGKNGET